MGVKFSLKTFSAVTVGALPLGFANFSGQKQTEQTG
jgi:hypothetical protein